MISESDPTFKVNVVIEELSKRIDLALLENLRETYSDLSRARLKVWFQEKKISYQGKTLDASDVFFPGTYEISLEHCEFSSPQAIPSPNGNHLLVVYEDDDLLIFNKESGIPSTPHSSEEVNTAVNSALAYFPELAQVIQTPSTEGPSALEPGLLHRLDNETSGLLVFTKSLTEYQRLKALWKGHQIRKIYRAWVVAPDSLADPLLRSLPFTIQYSLGHDAKSSKKMIALSGTSDRSPNLGLNSAHSSAHKTYGTHQIRGKPLTANTLILSAKHVQPFRSSPHLDPLIHSKLEAHQKILDLEIEIKTGVMHQIRCHLASIGLPILGDALYRGYGSNRIWLHAWRLEIPLKNQERLSIEAPLPTHW